MQAQEITLFVCGDVMTGRGVDQILRHPGNPRLFEASAASALDYVALAERRSGPIARPAGAADIWGDALAILDARRPDLRLINLETAVTASEDAWPGKPVLYRMHPANVPAIQALAPDCCVLANNHVMDWGHSGLLETLRVLQGAGVRTAGAGRDLSEAAAAVRLASRGGGQVLVFAFAVESSGVPGEWAATDRCPGVAWLSDLAPARAAEILDAVVAQRRPGDVVVVPLHWGANWCPRTLKSERVFARQLIEGGVDLVHGHSSHHPRGIEIYRERLILYGCGDFLNDYEGISGYDSFRPELALMYFPTVEARTGRLLRLEMVPTRVRRMRVNRASAEEAAWLQAMLDREGAPLGTVVEREVRGDSFVLRLVWSKEPH
jgi:poly-gamma-glutamate synthesis protein (capsule biosynthesis protein)